MPNVRRLLTDRGVTFSHYFISDALCCPSRSSILRGQYAHNTGVESNGDLNGGFETAYRLGIEKSTIGTWLHDAGYRTAYIGKYLNKYPDTADQTYVPPGWDEFDSAVAGNPVLRIRLHAQREPAPRSLRRSAERLRHDACISARRSDSSERRPASRSFST